MKILVLTPYLPHRQVGHGGGTAVRDLVTWLARSHEVLLVPLTRPGEKDKIAEVEELGVAVSPVDFPDRTARGADRLSLLTGRAVAWVRSLQSGYPWFVEKYWSSDLSGQVLAIVEDFAPDVIQIEYLQLALLVRDLRRRRDRLSLTGPRLILNSHELGSVPRDRRAARSGNPVAAYASRLEARAWRRLQVDASGWADTTLCVTAEDHGLFQAMGGKNLRTVPLGMDLENVRPDWAPGPGCRLLFVGSFGHRPNLLAADFLLDTVWPDLTRDLPGCRLTLAGRGSRSFLANRGGVDKWRARGIEALGFVDDLTPLFRASHLFVAPLPEGGGIKIKILEAMARGIPVVTTPVGAEGISGPDDAVLAVAPCDHRFAPAVLADMADPQASAARAVRARERIEARFGWAAITEELTQIYQGR